nr:phosphatidate phosphatase LPIN3 [Leptinotarsa decemlineata]
MHGMMKIISNVKDFYNEINGATLTGAIDVVVVEQPDGNFNCSPFHVRFGKLGVLRSKEKVVDVEINGEPQEIQMKLGESGEAFFVEEVVEDDENEIPEHLATSPIPVSEFENIFKNQRRRLSFDFEDISKLNLENQQNDYSIRRNTTENENTKTRERNFIKRQIGLGNIDIGENSAEEMTLSMISGKHSSEDLSRSHNDISETIFKMDSLDMESSKADDPKSETNDILFKIDHFFNEKNLHFYFANFSIQSGCQDISLSLCGWDPEPDSTRFLEHVVKFSDLCNTPVLFENPNLVVRIKDKYYNWKVAAPIIASFMIYGRPLLKSSIDQLCNMHMPAALTSKDFGPKQQQETKSSWWSWRRGKTSRETTPAPEKSTESEKTVETKDVTDIAEVAVEVVAGTETTVSETVGTKEETILQQSTNSNNEKRKKTLRLSSKQIASLNLRDGVNKVEFSVTTAYQGTTRCECYLYKWKWDDKIVISDIDGTITKSDVLGHILPIVGKDWAQTGVAQLFNKIKDNGYKLLYLSARAIGQARITRDYLKSIKQGDLTMPDGPVLLNPTSLITAFHREVIERKPEQFKISCMSDIKALFPSDSNPFYAGYGNRINDVWAYTAVGIPIVRIFTINPQGELKHELTETFQSSYSNMSIIVDQLFPSRLDAANDYSQNIYWRDPILPVEDLLD